MMFDFPSAHQILIFPSVAVRCQVVFTKRFVSQFLDLVLHLFRQSSLPKASIPHGETLEDPVDPDALRQFSWVFSSFCTANFSEAITNFQIASWILLLIPKVFLFGLLSIPFGSGVATFLRNTRQ